MTHFSIKLSPTLASQIHAQVLSMKWYPASTPYAKWGFSYGSTKVIWYDSGTFLIQGPDTGKMVESLGPYLHSEASEMRGHYQTHAGLDETGKGDIFGPLITACVIADERDIRKWELGGVKDSKKLSEAAIFKLEKLILSSKDSAHIICSPPMSEYNFYIGKTDENMNVYLAMLHAKALRQCLQLKHTRWGILDKFAGPELIEQYIYAPGFRLTYRTKAESDVAVAAASILARAAQLRAFEALSTQFNIRIPRGASEDVKEVLRQMERPVVYEIAKHNFSPVQMRLAGLL